MDALADRYLDLYEWRCKALAPCSALRLAARGVTGRCAPVPAAGA